MSIIFITALKNPYAVKKQRQQQKQCMLERVKIFKSTCSNVLLVFINLIYTVKLDSNDESEL